MSEGLYVLLGVLLGGLMNYVITLLLDRSRDRVAARVGALLVFEELVRSAVAVSALQEHGTWSHLDRAFGFGQRAEWDEHGQVLARSRRVTADEWLAVSQTYLYLEELVGRRARQPAMPDAHVGSSNMAAIDRSARSLALAVVYVGQVVHAPRWWNVRARLRLWRGAAEVKTVL